MKKIASILLVLVLALSLAAPAFAAEPEEENAAWTLYHMGLFLGTDTDEQGFPVFSLDTPLTRAQGVTMLVRLIGKEAVALEATEETPFTDVPDWAKPYVGYAYANGYTNGTTETTFDPDGVLTASEYLTFVLRALGYTTEKDFDWDEAWTLSDKLHITDGEYNADTKSFDRGNTVTISVSALKAKQKDGKKTLGELLAAEGIVSTVDRCVWQDTCREAKPGGVAFSFASAEGEKYKSFEISSVTANGVPCTITEQFTTAKAVKDFCDTKKVTLADAFNLVFLAYDEAAVRLAATEDVTVNGLRYPLVRYQLKCTGTLEDGTQVRELVVLSYYFNGYWTSFA